MFPLSDPVPTMAVQNNIILTLLELGLTYSKFQSYLISILTRQTYQPATPDTLPLFTQVNGLSTAQGSRKVST